jgi:predicted HicB family RNase H-like nuclease
MSGISWTHRGYTTQPEWDAEAGVFRGAVAGIRDVVTYEGGTFASALHAFFGSVDDYLEFCASLGREPERSNTREE